MNQSSSNLCISLFHLAAIVKSVIDLVSERKQQFQLYVIQNDDKDGDNDNEWTCDWESLIAHCPQASQPSGRTPPPEISRFQIMNFFSKLGGLQKIALLHKEIFWNV